MGNKKRHKRHQEFTINHAPKSMRVLGLARKTKLYQCMQISTTLWALFKLMPNYREATKYCRAATFKNYIVGIPVTFTGTEDELFAHLISLGCDEVVEQ